MSQVAIAGNIAGDPELKFAASGTAIAKFTVYESVKKGEERESHFYDCTMFGQSAENFVESAVKGDTVVLIGKLEQQKWETSDGDKRSKVAVVVYDAGLSVRWNTVEANRAERSA